MAVRKMPQNLEAEMSVLGSAFLNQRSLQKIMEEVEEDLFYNEANQKIFFAMKNLYLEKTPVDITTIKNELDKQKNLNAVGGIDYLSEMIDSVATTANLEHYIKIIREKATRRRLIDTATEIITDTYEEDGNITVLMEKAEKNILNVIRTRQTSEFQKIQDVLKKTQEIIEERAKNNTAVTGLSTGFYELDKATTGLHEGELIILAARPGMGKTAFALNIACNAAATTKKAIALFNLEMSSDQLATRMIGSVGQIEGDKLKTGRLNHNDWKRFNEAVSQLSDTNIYIEDNAGITSSEIKAKCRRLASSEEGLALVVIDYLQLVTTGGRNESRQVEVSEISRAFKTMALELKVPVIALAQLSRNAERRENTQPKLSDLRESGSIEQDADLVMFINRADYYDVKTAENKTNIVPAEIIIAKHRQGSTGVSELLFEMDKGSFKNYMKVESEF